MEKSCPGDTRPKSIRLLKRLHVEYGSRSKEFRTAWRFFKAGYDAAMDDFIEATTVGSENANWYNEEPTLQVVRKELGIRRSRR